PRPLEKPRLMPPEVSALAVEPPMVAALTSELSASLPILFASSIPALPRSQSLTRVPALPWRAPAPPPVPPWRAPASPALPLAPPWRAPVPLAPPWRAPAPLAPPWRAPVPPAPPWWAPSLLVLPQSSVPPHGPGPPTLALIALAPVANQALYINPGLSLWDSR
ncbi:hypothetical protein M9458_002582, partial [Cirrhinus mrigala]